MDVWMDVSLDLLRWMVNGCVGRLLVVGVCMYGWMCP